MVVMYNQIVVTTSSTSIILYWWNWMAFLNHKQTFTSDKMSSLKKSLDPKGQEIKFLTTSIKCHTINVKNNWIR